MTLTPIPAGTFDGIGPGPVYIHDSFGHAQRTRLSQKGSLVDEAQRAGPGIIPPCGTA
jgi:hypothetical protein